MLDQLQFQLDHHTADLEPDEALPSDEVKEIILDAVSRNRISRSRGIENLFFVDTGIRNISMFHPVDISEILTVHDLARRLGLGMVVRKCGNRVYKVFIFADSENMVEIPDIYESLGFQKFIIAQIAIARMSGVILEFPECCVESFVNHLMQGTDQDLAATETLRSESNPDPDAYFVERFVPCSPNCGKALSIGGKVTQDLEEVDSDMADLYEELKREHMEEVRSGSINQEKKERDRAIVRNQDGPLSSH